MKNVTYNFYEKFYYISKSIILDLTVILIRINIIFYVLYHHQLCHVTRLFCTDRLTVKAISHREIFIEIYTK